MEFITLKYIYLNQEMLCPLESAGYVFIILNHVIASSEAMI